MPIPGQRDRKREADVAAVHHDCDAVAERQVELALVLDRHAARQQVLHEEVRADHRPVETRTLDLLLDTEVQGRDRARRFRPRLQRRQLDDVSDAGGLGEVDELHLHRFLLLAVRQDQCGSLATRERLADDARVAHVADDQLRAGRLQGRRLLRVAD